VTAKAPRIPLDAGFDVMAFGSQLRNYAVLFPDENHLLKVAGAHAVALRVASDLLLGDVVGVAGSLRRPLRGSISGQRRRAETLRRRCT